jgi:hypothetical protein
MLREQEHLQARQAKQFVRYCLSLFLYYNVKMGLSMAPMPSYLILSVLCRVDKSEMSFYVIIYYVR